MTSKTDTVVYYISNKELCYQDLKQFYKRLPGFIEVIIDHQEQIMTIIDLQSTIHGKGNAMHLIKRACQNAFNMGINKVILDDCSDHYRKPHNIYIKMGFKYNQKDGPEMTGSTKKISEFDISSTFPTIHEIHIKRKKST